ncbi:MAG: hypothetical protein IJU41_01855 [Clostridia bacterium]|nr:hypothetical protein [Clostridia bacterium]
MGTEEKRSPFLRALGALLKLFLVLALLGYILYHLTGGFSTPVQTLTVSGETVSVTIPLSGSIFRNERVITGAGGAAVGYPSSDGTKVGIGDKIATLYRTGDRTSLPRILQIDASLDLLAAADVGESASISYGVAARQILKTELLRLSDARARGRIGKLCEEENTLLAAMLRRDVILTGARGVDELTRALQSERASLAAKLSGGSSVVTAPLSGYLYHTADGYEGAVAFADLPSLTPSGYRAAMERRADTADAVCKIVTDPLWYFAGTLKTENAYDLTVGQSYTVAFGEREIPMKLYAKNEENGEVLLVFGSRLLKNELFRVRSRKVTVCTERVTGYKVPSSALRLLDGVTGVYVRRGSSIEYRVCEVLYEDGGYVWLSPDTEGRTLYADDGDKDNDLYCKGICRYDNVVVAGAVDLSPHKILN